MYYNSNNNILQHTPEFYFFVSYVAVIFFHATRRCGKRVLCGREHRSKSLPCSTSVAPALLSRVIKETIKYVALRVRTTVKQTAGIYLSDVLRRSTIGPCFIYLLSVENIYVFYYPDIGSRRKYEMFKWVPAIDSDAYELISKNRISSRVCLRVNSNWFPVNLRAQHVLVSINHFRQNHRC